ncbi:TMhelix containing protein [Vibrio phage 1.170.O._10N.261.52.C3]|nr:TMhelix containing protein [Vibrio phage 1.170.O._10N.261.52.C3]
MNNTWLTVIILVILISLTTSCSNAAYQSKPAPHEQDTSRIEGMIPELSDWIVKNTHFEEVDKPLPKVVILKDIDFKVILNLPRADYVYYQTINTIYVKKSNVGSYDLKIYLTHELIHFYQIWSDNKYSCLRDLEREAYSLQEKFGQESGLYVHYELNKNHNLWLNTYVSCDKVNFNKMKLK